MIFKFIMAFVASVKLAAFVTFVSDYVQFAVIMDASPFFIG